MNFHVLYMLKDKGAKKKIPSVCLSACLDICMTVCLPVRLYVCLSVCLSGYVYACLYVRPSVRLSVWISACLTVCPSVRLYVRLSVFMSVCPSVCMYVCLYLCLSVCLDVWMYVRTWTFHVAAITFESKTKLVRCLLCMKCRSGIEIRSKIMILIQILILNIISNFFLVCVGFRAEEKNYSLIFWMKVLVFTELESKMKNIINEIKVRRRTGYPGYKTCVYDN